MRLSITTFTILSVLTILVIPWLVVKTTHADSRTQRYGAITDPHGAVVLYAPLKVVGSRGQTLLEVRETATGAELLLNGQPLKEK